MCVQLVIYKNYSKLYVHVTLNYGSYLLVQKLVSY